MKSKKKKIHISIWYLLFALWTLILINSYFLAPRETKITYSQFKDDLAQGYVNEVLIDAETIRGKRTIPGETDAKKQTFVVTRVEDPDLVKELRKQGVTFSGKHENKFLKNLFSLIVPALFFVGIWMFLMRRIGRGPEFMSVGRSKAKIYADNIQMALNDSPRETR